jgi:hypothetical protein
MPVEPPVEKGLLPGRGPAGRAPGLGPPGLRASPAGLAPAGFGAAAPGLGAGRAPGLGALPPGPAAGPGRWAAGRGAGSGLGGAVNSGAAGPGLAPDGLGAAGGGVGPGRGALPGLGAAAPGLGAAGPGRGPGAPGLGAPPGLGALLPGAPGFADFLAPPALSASDSLRTTGASIVEDAERTNSPSSWSLAMTTLLSTPSSLASSYTRTLATSLLTVRGGSSLGPSLFHGRTHRVLIECSSQSRPTSDSRGTWTAW